MLVVVEFERLFRHVRRKRFIIIRQVRKGKGHGELHLLAGVQLCQERYIVAAGSIGNAAKGWKGMK